MRPPRGDNLERLDNIHGMETARWRRPLGRQQPGTLGSGQPSGGGSGPPDFDDIIRQGRDRFRNLMPSGLGGYRSLIVIILLLVIVWLMTGLYRVQPGEKGVEMLFGKFIKTTDPDSTSGLPGRSGPFIGPTWSARTS